MIAPIVAGMISLWVNACIDGTLHGQPKMLCREFQIRAYGTVEACEKAHDKAVEDWLDGLKPFDLSLHVAGSHCGPAEAEGDDI